MASVQMKVETEHPALFLSDPRSDAAVPNDTSEAFVTTTDTCICFWVLSYVDGASTVTLSDEECGVSGLDLFSGSVECPSWVQSLSDSSAFAYINVPVSAGRISVNVRTDNEVSPNWVWIKLDSFRAV